MPVAPPPPHRLPLNALRAIEAAARLGGFAAAGAELGLSPAAVAAHVKGAERDLGLRLFLRDPRGVRLTEAGARCLPPLSAAFDALTEAERVLRAEAAPLRVSLATLPAIAQLWVQPRLPELTEAFPGLQVSITALEGPPNVKRHAFDLTLFYASGGEEVLVPVRAPGAARDLRLGDAVWSADWTFWRQETGLSAPGGTAGPVHSLYALAIEDAVQGRGCAMGRWTLVRPLVEAGRLVEAGPRVTLPEGIAVTRAGRTPVARKLAEWIGNRLALERPTRTTP